MALLLSSERPGAAAARFSLVPGFVRWFANYRKTRAKRLMLAALLELEDHRLNDLGLVRQDVLDLLHTKSPAARDDLTSRRARRARAWLHR